MDIPRRFRSNSGFVRFSRSCTPPWPMVGHFPRGASRTRVGAKRVCQSVPKCAARIGERSDWPAGDQLPAPGAGTNHSTSAPAVWKLRDSSTLTPGWVIAGLFSLYFRGS